MLSVLGGRAFAYTYARALDPVISAMLQDNYGKALEECRLLERTANKSVQGDVLLAEGVCLTNLGDYAQARDVFKQATAEAQGALLTELYIGIADSFFLQEDYDKAIDIYNQLLTKSSAKDYLAMLYYKLGKAHQKKSSWAQSDYYFNLLKRKFPASLEAKLVVQTQVGGNFFTIQVGCFTRQQNAQKLYDDLKVKGYEAYITPFESRGQTLYRVRVGEYVSRMAAEFIENQLKTRENLPTHIFP